MHFQFDQFCSVTTPPCINYMQYPWGYALPMRICIIRESYHQYPWAIPSVPVRVCITRESYPQYPWVISSVPVSHILSTGEDMQYLWVISSVPVSHILSTCESYPQYPWGYAVPVSKFIWMKNEWNFPHGYSISSQVLHTLTGTEDMTHGYGGYDLRVLKIWLTGNAYPHRYWGYDSPGVTCGEQAFPDNMCTNNDLTPHCKIVLFLYISSCVRRFTNVQLIWA